HGETPWISLDDFLPRRAARGTACRSRTDRLKGKLVQPQPLLHQQDLHERQREKHQHDDEKHLHGAIHALAVFVVLLMLAHVLGSLRTLAATRRKGAGRNQSFTWPWASS